MFGLSLTRTVKRLEACLAVAKEAVDNLKFDMSGVNEVSIVKGKIIIPDDANLPSYMFRIDVRFDEKVIYRKFMQGVDEFFSDFCEEMDIAGEYACCRFTDTKEEEESNGKV